MAGMDAVQRAATMEGKLRTGRQSITLSGYEVAEAHRNRSQPCTSLPEKGMPASIMELALACDYTLYIIMTFASSDNRLLPSARLAPGWHVQCVSHSTLLDLAEGVEP